MDGRRKPKDWCQGVRRRGLGFLNGPERLRGLGTRVRGFRVWGLGIQAFWVLPFGVLGLTAWALGFMANPGLHTVLGSKSNPVAGPDE